MLNVMEERDIQVRGYTLRLPLDVVVVASANPEDYTNRGRIITPPQGPGSAPRSVPTTRWNSRRRWASSNRSRIWLPKFPSTCCSAGAFARHLRESHSIDQRSGCRRGSRIAAAETVAAAPAPLCRAWRVGSGGQGVRPRHRDRRAARKLEFESGEEGREQAVLEHLLRRATADTAQRMLGASTSDRW